MSWKHGYKRLEEIKWEKLEGKRKTGKQEVKNGSMEKREGYFF